MTKRPNWSSRWALSRNAPSSSPFQPGCLRPLASTQPFSQRESVFSETPVAWAISRNDLCSRRNRKAFSRFLGWIAAILRLPLGEVAG